MIEALTFIAALSVFLLIAALWLMALMPTKTRQRIWFDN